MRTNNNDMFLMCNFIFNELELDLSFFFVFHTTYTILDWNMTHTKYLELKWFDKFLGIETLLIETYLKKNKKNSKEIQKWTVFIHLT